MHCGLCQGILAVILKEQTAKTLPIPVLGRFLLSLDAVSFEPFVCLLVLLLALMVFYAFSGAVLILFFYDTQLNRRCIDIELITNNNPNNIKPSLRLRCLGSPLGFEFLAQPFATQRGKLTIIARRLCLICFQGLLFLQRLGTHKYYQTHAH